MYFIENKNHKNIKKTKLLLKKIAEKKLCIAEKKRAFSFLLIFWNLYFFCKTLNIKIHLFHKILKTLSNNIA